MNFEYDEETKSAIKQWQTDNGFQATGKLSSSEEELISQSTSYVTGLTQIYLLIDKMKVCQSFSSSNHRLSGALDRDADNNFKTGQTYLQNVIDQSHQCNEIEADQSKMISERTYSAYKDSFFGKTKQKEIKLGFRISDNVAIKRVEECNKLSRAVFMDMSSDVPTCTDVEEYFKSN